MKKFIPVIMVVVLVGAAVSLLMIRKAQLADAKPASVLPVVVNTVKLAEGAVTLSLPAMGMVASDLSTTLSSRVSGRVFKVYKQEGEAIQEGETLARIDSRELVAKKEALLLKSQGLEYRIVAGEENVKAMEIGLAAARESHARTDQLLKVKGASVEEFRREEATLAGISAKLSAARNTVATLKKEKDSLDQNILAIDAQLSYATITAPISGTLAKRMVMAGDLAMPGTPLLRIAANDGLHLNLSLPTSVNAKEILFQGRKIPLAPKHQATATGLRQYLAQLPGNSGLVEGQFLTVRVLIYDAADVLVPVDGLLTIGGKSFVFTFANQQATKVEVAIKARGTEGVVLAANLAGSRILVAKPDILLRVSAGVPVYAHESGQQTASAGNNAATAE